LRRSRTLVAGLWVALLLAILGFLVILSAAHPAAGALTDTNPVVEGFSLRHLSITNFLVVWPIRMSRKPCSNTLIASARHNDRGVIGRRFSWIVVRTIRRSRGSLPPPASSLFAPPLVAGVAWAILGSPKTGLITPCSNGPASTGASISIRCGAWCSCSASITRRTSTCSPSSALRNMDPSLEEAAEIFRRQRVRDPVLGDVPAVMPAIVSGMLLSFIVMLGIYGIPAVLARRSISAC